MRNAAFMLLKKYPTLHKSLSSKHQLKITLNAFLQSQELYFRVELPLLNDVKLMFNGANLKVVEHHFTIAQSLDKKTLNSQYHYSLYLQDKRKVNYRVHVYFDKFDRVVVEPLLFKSNGEKYESLSTLSDNEKEQLYNYALGFSNVITDMREFQNIIISSLTRKIEQVEEQLLSLRPTLNRAKKEYIQLCEKQLENIVDVESLCDTSYGNDKKFYEKELELLREEANLTQLPPLVEPVVEQQQEEASTEVAIQDDQITPIKNSKKKAKKSQLKKASQSVESLFTVGEKLLKDYDVASSPTEAQLKEMADTLAFFNAAVEVKTHRDKIFEIRYALSRRLKDYFKKCPVAANGALIIWALRTHLISIDDRLIEEIIKTDNVDLLQAVLALDIIAQSTLFKFTGSVIKFNLLEGCIHFGSPNCFAVLLRANYTLDYISGDKSPIFSLAGDNLKYYEFIETNMNLGGKKIKEKLLAILKSNMEKATDPKFKRLYKAKIEITKHNSATRKLLEKRPIWKKLVITDATKESNVAHKILYAKFGREAVDQYYALISVDVDIQETLVKVAKAISELFETLDSIGDCVPLIRILLVNTSEGIANECASVVLDDKAKKNIINNYVVYSNSIANITATIKPHGKKGYERALKYFVAANEVEQKGGDLQLMFNKLEELKLDPQCSKNEITNVINLTLNPLSTHFQPTSVTGVSSSEVTIESDPNLKNPTVSSQSSP
jgi:hypothetical protein